MLFVALPSSSPVLYWALAVVWSLYQGYVGYHYGAFIYDSARRAVDTQSNASSVDSARSGDRKGEKASVDWSKNFTRRLAYGGHHAALYALSCFAGFLAWALGNELTRRIDSWSSVGGGTGAVAIAVASVAVLGVSGALGRILYLGNRPT